MPGTCRTKSLNRNVTMCRSYRDRSRISPKEGEVSLGENCALVANQSVHCNATILFTISLNFAKVWNRGINWPVYGVRMHKKSSNVVSSNFQGHLWPGSLGDLLCILTPNTGQLNPLFHTFAEFRLIVNRIVVRQSTDWLAANAQFSPNVQCSNFHFPKI